MCCAYMLSIFSSQQLGHMTHARANAQQRNNQTMYTSVQCVDSGVAALSRSGFSMLAHQLVLNPDWLSQRAHTQRQDSKSQQLNVRNIPFWMISEKRLAAGAVVSVLFIFFCFHFAFALQTKFCKSMRCAICMQNTLLSNNNERIHVYLHSHSHSHSHCSGCQPQRFCRTAENHARDYILILIPLRRFFYVYLLLFFCVVLLLVFLLHFFLLCARFFMNVYMHDVRVRAVIQRTWCGMSYV